MLTVVYVALSTQSPSYEQVHRNCLSQCIRIVPSVLLMPHPDYLSSLFLFLGVEVTTKVSLKDRANAVLMLLSSNSKHEDFNCP
jgi:hypothetical protein